MKLGNVSCGKNVYIAWENSPHFATPQLILREMTSEKLPTYPSPNTTLALSEKYVLMLT